MYKIKFIILSSQTHHPLVSPNASKNKPSDPAAQGRSPGVSPEPLSLASDAPSILCELVAALLASLAPLPPCRHGLHQPLFLFPGLLVDSFWQKKKFNLSTCLSPSLSTPFFSLHVVIRMAVKANVTVSFPHSKFLSCLYIQFRIIFKSEHFEMMRTCVWTLVCHLCGLSGYLISLSLFLVSDLGIIPTYLIALSWGLNEILFMMRLAQCLVHSKCPHCSTSLRSLQVSFYVTSKRHLLIMQNTVHPP